MYYVFIAAQIFRAANYIHLGFFFISLVICIKKIFQSFLPMMFLRYSRVVKWAAKTGGKNVTCLATLLQNEFHRYVSRFTTHELNLSCTKSGCCTLLKVVAES